MLETLRLFSVSTTVTNLVLSSCVLFLISCALYLLRRSYSSHGSYSRSAEQQTQDAKSGQFTITPLTVPWQQVDPLRIRPFKKQYHLTMGLENMRLEDLVAIDKTYLDRIKLRREIITEHPAATMACNNASVQAVSELHEWMFEVYLPQRCPTMFERSRSEKRVVTKNLVTGEVIATHEGDAMTALHDLGSHVDTDFLFLIPSSTTKDDLPIYHLEAFVTCFPSGFSSRSKLGKPLAEIHKPVPGYAVKLERSMDRYFAKVADNIVKRANWTITTSDDLFIEAGTHLYLGDNEQENQAELQRQRDDIIVDNCRLRAERQTLHRLPKSKALVFAFKTYQYRLNDVKAEGDGLALADAIDGLATGSVPEMHFYKRGIVWGEKVTQYLRG